MEAGKQDNISTENLNGIGRTLAGATGGVNSDPLSSQRKDAGQRIGEIGQHVSTLAKDEFSHLAETGTKVLRQGERYLTQGVDLVKKRPLTSLAAAAVLGLVVGASVSRLASRS